MARIVPLPELQVGQPEQGEAKRSVVFSNNAEATLSYSRPALNAYLQWHQLYEAVAQKLGKRRAYLFGFSICHTIGCGLCTAFFRKLIIEGGEIPEDLRLTGSDKTLYDFGSSIARYQGNIADHVYNQAATVFNKQDLVLLAAFAGQMIAATVFNNIVETDVDEILSPYLPPIPSIWNFNTR